ncbi:hypothetical protein [Rhodococcus sp. I2R]|uniref:hypothetical protein n=1 Tax=Rhodococcus sp. I2R TaxID=2855445 RepID=UPI001E4C4B84|nr:hypothetical protein [Rhodococcus sp. I2R]MCC8930813.1 hypothetical protein [Rhodococcus sp. I2R]
MSEIVSADQIEQIVGAPRTRNLHYGRAVSAEQRVYILHSRRCVDSGIDLRECPYSVALDRGIDIDQWWAGNEDVPVVLGIRGPHLVPLRRCVAR